MILFTDINMRKTVVITESQLFKLLLEAMSLDGIHDKYYQKIDKNTFFAILQCDPTYTEGRMGKYGKWLLSLYQNGNLKEEDLYKAKEYLTAFNKFKNRIAVKDIMQFKTLPDLYNTVKPFMENPDQATSNSDEIRRAKENVNKIYEDGDWLVISPQTEEAAVYYGKGTQWCTAADKSENLFNNYHNQGELYINIDKRNNRKYQFHFESDQFMDERDYDIEKPVAATIGLPENIVNWYVSKYGVEAAIPLKTTYDIDYISEIENEYYDDLYIDDTGSKLFCFNGSDFVDIAEIKSFLFHFGTYAYGGRFIVVYDDYNHEEDIYDLEDDSYITDKIEYGYHDGINRIVPYQICAKIETDSDFWILDYKTGNLSKIEREINGNYIIYIIPLRSSTYKLVPIHNYQKECKYIPYNEVYSAITEDNNNIIYFKNKPLSNQKYKKVGREDFAYKGWWVKMASLIDEKGNCTILLYDGRIVPFNTLASTSDRVFDEMFRNIGIEIENI